MSLSLLWYGSFVVVWHCCCGLALLLSTNNVVKIFFELLAINFFESNFILLIYNFVGCWRNSWVLEELLLLCFDIVF